MKSNQPDIVFLVLDTQRTDRLSCYGHQQQLTPHIDALAAESTLFGNATATAQWTIPSHASMFTGHYPSAHATQQSYSMLPSTMPTLAERLRDDGYFTAAFCNNPLVGVVDNGLRRGFQSFLNYSGLMTSRPNQAGAKPTLVDRYRQLFKRIVGGLVNRIQDSFARSEALLAFSFNPFFVPLWQTALSFKGNTTKSLNDAARLLIDRRDIERDQPAFAFVNLMGTHMPYHPQRQFVQQFAPGFLHDREAQRFIHRFNLDIFGWMTPLMGTIDAEHKATLDGVYNAEVAGQDAQIGLFLDKLRASGRLDNTMIIVCADHGEHLGEKHFIGHSVSAYNELVRVPLMIRSPNGDFTSGAVVDQAVSTRRIFHTALAAAGSATPEEQRYSLAQHAASDPDGGTVFAEAMPVENVLRMMQQRRPDLVSTYLCDQPRRAVWNGQHKLIQTGNDGVELFDLHADPHEQVNLSAILPEQVDTLQERLDAFVHQSATAAPIAQHHNNTDDPEVRRRLRDLGYLE